MDEVVVKGHRYQIGRLLPNVGILIFNKVVKAGLLAGEHPQLFMGYLSNDEYEYIQTESLAILSRENPHAPGTFLPVYDRRTRGFAFKDLEEDSGATVLKLVAQVIELKIIPFFLDNELPSPPTQE